MKNIAQRALLVIVALLSSVACATGGANSAGKAVEPVTDEWLAANEAVWRPIVEAATK